MSKEALKEQICVIGRRLYERGLIAAGDGNVSVRVDDTILTTPRSVCKGFLKPDMIVKVALDGKKLEGQMAPSSELPMHILIYKERPDVHAVVHAHPPVATGFAAAGQPLDKAIVSEVVLTLGCIPLAAYGTPSTDELTDTLRPLVKHHDAILMANHGAVAYGANLEVAYGRMETIEHIARISLVARLLGGEKELTHDEVQKLIELREKAGYMSSDKRYQACGFLKEVPLRQEETFTLTKSELIELAKRIELQLKERLWKHSE
ncbi:MAG: class II aldolase/adducin family protein [Acidobacteriota bacterium]|nr:class II aldolase/adducin family protein [Acidobacteriota bacterium]